MGLTDLDAKLVRRSKIDSEDRTYFELDIQIHIFQTQHNVRVWARDQR